MTVEEEFRSKIETDSHRYGNEKTIEDTFGNPFNPHPPGLEEALADTVHLTEQEASVVAQGHFGGLPGASDEQLADEMAQSWGFERYAEYKTVKAAAMEKIADAIRIYELIDAYRFLLPDECSNCGKAIEGAQFEIKEEKAIALCRDCADDESGEEYVEEERVAVLGEVEALLEDIEAKTGQQPNRVRQNLNIARANLLDDGEFDTCVRFALVKLDEAAAKAEEEAAESRDQITRLLDQLSEKAALPPQDEFTR